MSDEPTYTMTLSLGIIDHLGLNLYSNIPAVLSELVANAWDADADRVEITFDRASGEIKIIDDGDGMTIDDINQRFLKVGYRRRQDRPLTTKKGRHVMGRKGIGKLSTFSIANEVELQTRKKSNENDTWDPCGFILRTDVIREQIKQGEISNYHPEKMKAELLTISGGTSIILRHLRSRVTKATSTWLRRRLARRFSMLGTEIGFSVSIDGLDVSISDRDYFSKIEYLWSVGDVGDRYENLAVNAKKKDRISGVIDTTNLSADDVKELPASFIENGTKKPKALVVRGWIGTFVSQEDIDEGNNTISILAWKKLVHEDILKDVRSGGLYTKYLIGEIEADFLDSDTGDDIVTSDRQRLNEDDVRFRVFKSWATETALKKISNHWRDWRRDQAIDVATQNPVVDKWYKSLTPTSRSFAKKLFGKIGAFPIEDDSAKKELYRHTILAFERLRFRDLLSSIDQLGDELHATGFSALFQSIDDLEAVQYHNIARGRLEIIRSFDNKLQANEKEKIIQKYLFDHLWLLHPAWERAAILDPVMEKNVQNALDVVINDLTDEERKARLDLAFRTAPDRHVIIELKRYGVKIKGMELVDQIHKYRAAADKALRKFNDNRTAEIIAVIGDSPAGMENDMLTSLLERLGARWITYDQLISDALASYSKYLDAQKSVSELAQLIEKI